MKIGRSILTKLCFVAAIWAATSTVHASLIGDEVIVNFVFGSPTELGPVTVAAGSGDAVAGENFTVDVEAEGFSVIWDLPSGFPSNTYSDFGFFNGLVLDDLDWVGVPTGILTGLVIDTDLQDWNDGKASFTDHSASFDWAGTTYVDGTFFNVTFETDHGVSDPTPVPEPTALALMTIGLAGLGCRRRGKGYEKH